MPQRKSQELCKILSISFGYFFHKSFRFWKKSRFENSMWVADNIRTTNSTRSSSSAHFGFSNLDFFQNWMFLWKCYPIIVKGSLPNFSGLPHCIISQPFSFKNQKLLHPCQWKYWHRAKNRVWDKAGFGMYNLQNVEKKGFGQTVCVSVCLAVSFSSNSHSPSPRDKDCFFFKKKNQ